MKQKYFWLKLTGTALLLHIVLILLSVLEVTIYSYLVDPGQDREYYEAYARESAPWISYIFGSLFIFLLVKRFILQFKQQHLLYAFALPVVYGIIDYMLLTMMAADASALVNTQFIVGKVVKILAALIAYFIYTKKNRG